MFDKQSWVDAGFLTLWCPFLPHLPHTHTHTPSRKCLLVNSSMPLDGALWPETQNKILMLYFEEASWFHLRVIYNCSAFFMHMQEMANECRKE